MDMHRQLRVWQLARSLVNFIYKLTRSLPSEEKYVVIPQLRRAAWSVLNNIAEGHAKLGRKERRRFFDVALGSLAEIDAMVATLPDIYQVEECLIESIGNARVGINTWSVCDDKDRPYLTVRLLTLPKCPLMPLDAP